MQRGSRNAVRGGRRERGPYEYHHRLLLRGLLVGFLQWLDDFLR